MSDSSPHLVLYDATCGLCDRTVQWLLDHDTAGLLSFAPLQGPTADKVRRDFPEIPADIDSIVFIDTENGVRKVYWRSRAVMRICSYLPAPQRWWSWFRFVPPVISDAAYRIVANHRYKIWGRLDQCRIPTAEQRLRFLP